MREPRNKSVQQWFDAIAERFDVATNTKKRKLADWLNDRCRQVPSRKMKCYLIITSTVVSMYLAYVIIMAFN